MAGLLSPLEAELRNIENSTTLPIPSVAEASKQQVSTLYRPRVSSIGDSLPKTRLYEMLEFNRGFVDRKDYTQWRSSAPPPAKRAVVVSCMDSRLMHLLPHALNLKDGDAKMIKTAGAIITHPFGGIMRSIIVAVYDLRADEVFVVGHYGCGMSSISPASTVEKMVNIGGISRETLSTLEYAGIDVESWLHGFDDVSDAVASSVSIITRHPLMPKWVLVHGLLIDPNTGKLDVVVDGNTPEIGPIHYVESGFASPSHSAAKAPAWHEGDECRHGDRDVSPICLPEETLPPISASSPQTRTALTPDKPRVNQSLLKQQARSSAAESWDAAAMHSGGGVRIHGSGFDRG